MRVRCPYCGRVFEVDVGKGRGASYAGRIRRLGRLHLEVLRVLDEYAPLPLTKEEIRVRLGQRGVVVSGNSLSGRLSELLGLGLVEMGRARVRVLDPDAMVFRFVSKPVWCITERGRRVLEAVPRSGRAEG